MATTKKKISKIDEGEAIINFRYGLGIMKQNGDTAGLAKAKKAHPALYADWEKRQAAISADREKKQTSKKTGRK